MKLLVINYEFPPVGGGAAHASLEAAKELVALGHGVDFLTIATGAPLPEEQLGGVRVHGVTAYRRGLHQVSLAGAGSFLAAAALRLPRLAADKDYDLYHYYFGLPTGLLSFIPGDHRHRPYVVSLRGSDVPGYDPRLTALHRAMLPLTRRIWQKAAAVVANSEGLRNLALASRPGRSIDVIRNGVHVPDLPRSSEAKDGSVRILVVSRLIERKGIDTLLQAVARLGDPRVRVDIAGEGPDRARLEEVARAAGLAGRARFHGFAERAALDQLYAEADVFALTSRSESCSMALLDAIAAGLPVVATDVGGTPELVEHGTNGLLVQPGDVGSLAAALAALIRDPVLRQQLGAQGRSRALGRHSWHAVASQYEALFQSAIESQRRARGTAMPRVGTVGAVPASRES